MKRETVSTVSVSTVSVFWGTDGFGSTKHSGFLLLLKNIASLKKKHSFIARKITRYFL